MKPTKVEVFQSRFYNRIRELLGGPKAASDFFRKHPKLLLAEAKAARESHAEGTYGFTPKGAANEWYKLTLEPILC